MNNIEAYNQACIDIVEDFTKRFLGNDFEEGDKIEDYYYIIGGMDNLPPSVVDVNEDWFFDIEDMWTTIKHDIPMDIVMKWYNQRLDKVMDGEDAGINLYHYWKMETGQLIPMTPEEKEEAIRDAEQKFQNALDNYKTFIGKSE